MVTLPARLVCDTQIHHGVAMELRLTPSMVAMVAMVHKPCASWRLGNAVRPHRKATAFGPLLGMSLANRLRSRRCRSATRSPLAACGRTELLVDADAHSIDLIRQAITLLEDEFCKVETTLFAAPRRVENKKWCQFMEEPGITFEAVARSSMAQPNQIAIQRTLRSFADDDVAHVAVLTSDTAFLDALVELPAKKRTSAIVVVPDSKGRVVSKYSDANLKVLKLQMSSHAPRVQAILHDNGDGSVHLVDPYNRFDNTAEAELVIAFLQDLGFMRHQDEYLIQAAARFWFANRLGPLTVFPGQLAVRSVYEEMTLSKAYAACHGNFVFFLPVSARGSMTKKALETYGSQQARQIFRGGGPFMLYDSLDLTAQALRRLGYLDDDLNDDLTEALFCFLNTSVNKIQLTRLGALPVSGARSSDVCEQLRAAFLSHESPCQWQYMRRGQTSMAPVLQILQNAKVLAGTEYVPKEVLEAMKMYSEQHGLPSMRTFNGFATRILRSVEKNPACRAFIEINK